MIQRIATLLGTALSFVSLVFAIKPVDSQFTAVQGGLIAAAILMFVWLMVYDLIQFGKTRPQTVYKTDEALHRYLYERIDRAGRVVIFTRDMSWADNQQFKALLIKKTRQDELTICLPKDIPFTQELERLGAKIYAYGHLTDYVPRSRFTIVNSGRADAQVAIGKGKGGNHTVEEYSEGGSHVFSIANDLVEIVKTLSSGAASTTSSSS